MSAAEYLIWEPTQEQRYEYWDDEVIAMSGGTRNHNRVSLNFSKLLDDTLADRSCEVYVEIAIADLHRQVQFETTATEND
jgi:Uma2 family endonuclease